LKKGFDSCVLSFPSMRSIFFAFQSRITILCAPRIPNAFLSAGKTKGRLEIWSFTLHRSRPKADDLFRGGVTPLLWTGERLYPNPVGDASFHS
jgi:hypothetical protein